MQNVTIRFVGNASMGSVYREIAKVEAGIKSLNASASHVAQGPNGFNTKWLNDYSVAIDGVRNSFRSAINAHGAFNLQSRVVESQSSRLTEAIQKQRFGLGDLVREHKNLSQVYRDQISLQKSVVMQWGRTSGGGVVADLISPRGVGDAAAGLRSLRQEMGFYNTVLASVADQTVKWGKNTQWAGRQLTAGLSMPIVAAGAGIGTLAYQLDKGLTQVIKVYGDASTAATTSDAQIREATTATARKMAADYAQASSDTVEIASQLAASGQVGKELQSMTGEVSRARILGELNLQDAMKATITMQSLYQMNSEKLAETFNFMNSMENQTNLTMQDFVVGVPKAAGVIKEFGGSVQDVGVLLAGMKAAGIDAAEGANAIKSISFKIISPNQGSRDLFAQLTGKSFDETMKGTNGVVDRLRTLGESIEDLSPEDRVGLIQKMFGLYQGSKTLSLLTQLTDGSEQMSRAFEVASSSSEQWAATAERELTKLQGSGWNRIKAQWETMKLSLAEMGQPLLEQGAKVLTMLNGFLQWVRTWDDGTKRVAKTLVILSAIAGPLIMLAGLLANLMANFVKVSTFLFGLVAPYKLMNAEQTIASRLANQAETAIFKEGESFRFLTGQVESARAALMGYVSEQAKANFAALKASGPGAGVVRHERTGSLVVPYATAQGSTKYRPAGKHESAAFLAAEKSTMPAAAVASTQIAENAERTRRSWAGIGQNAAVFGAIGVSAMGSMATESGSVANNISNVLIMASMIGPTLAKGIVAAGSKIASSGIWQKASAMVMGGSASGKAAAISTAASRSIGAIKAAMPAIAAAGPVIAAGAVAIGVAWYNVDKAIRKTREEAQQFAASSKTNADIFGFAWTEAAKKVDAATGQAILNFEQKAQKMKEVNAGLAKQFEDNMNSSDEVKMAIAINEGAKARLHNATAEQATEIAAAALRAMGSRLTEEELKMKITAEVDFGDAKQNVEHQAKQLAMLIEQAQKGMSSQSKWESFGRFFTGDTGLNTQSTELIKAQSKEIWDTWAVADTAERERVFAEAVDASMKGVQEVYERMRVEQADVLKRFNINSATDLLKFYNGPNGKNAAIFDGETIHNLTIASEAARLFAEQWAELNSIPPPENIQDATIFMEQFAPSLKSAATETSNFTGATKTSAAAINNKAAAMAAARDDERLFRNSVVDTTDAIESGTTSTEAAIDAVLAFRDALNARANNLGIADSFDINADTASSMVDAYKKIYTDAMGSIYEGASRIMDAQNSATIDAIQARGDAAQEVLDSQQSAMQSRFDAQSKALSSKWDARKEAINDYYDNQISKIDAALKAEQDAESKRQKIFEAEQTRVQRLSQLYNRNVDINMAIQSGNLDEAARLTNDVIAMQQGWTSADAASASTDASQKKQDSISAQKNALESAKEAALKLAETQREAEQEALKHTQEVEEAKMRARKKALDQSIRDEMRAAKAKQDANKRALEIELALLKEYVPQNEAQLSAHIVRVQEAYKKYGGVLTAQGSGWGKIIGNALQNSTKVAATNMSNTIAWDNLGKSVAEQISKGAFNMTMSEFMNWVSTGNLPKNYSPPKVSGNKFKGEITMGSAHSGAIIGRDSGSRVGFSGKRQSQSEVLINALAGEAVLNRKATRNLGTDFIDMANAGLLPKNIGGPDLGAIGVGGLLTGLIGGMMRRAASNGIVAAGQRAASTGLDWSASGKAGKFGGSNFSIEQVRNAGIIASVGKGLGASSRDIIIALMTAMQESTLRNLNYGDRDSLGLFQQRAPWGSASDRTDPAKAARMFFLGGAGGQRGLFSFSNRDKMSLSQAAQSVQVSAFPSAYARWEDEAREMLASLSFTMNGGLAPLGMMGAGGWVRPANGPRTSPFGWRTHPIDGTRKFHTGTDIGAPSGAPIYAARAGKVAAVIPTDSSGGYGNYTIVDHGNGIKTSYAHQSRFGVRTGQIVQAGQTIGYVGTTGRSTGPHLHFEVVQNGSRVNPGMYIPGLEKGGFTMSDGLAMLHKKETVLTAPLSQKLKDGIHNMDNSSRIEANFNFEGAIFSKDIDVTKAVEDAFKKLEKRSGPSRKIGSRTS